MSTVAATVTSGGKVARFRSPVAVPRREYQVRDWHPRAERGALGFDRCDGDRVAEAVEVDNRVKYSEVLSTQVSIGNRKLAASGNSLRHRSMVDRTREDCASQSGRKRE